VLRVPAPLLRALLGELAASLLEGQFVLPRRLLAAGFAFRFPTLDGAFGELLARRR
jgi:NAD dependent epimerase/dehydratase family enzyme